MPTHMARPIAELSILPIVSPAHAPPREHEHASPHGTSWTGSFGGAGIRKLHGGVYARLCTRLHDCTTARLCVCTAVCMHSRAYTQAVKLYGCTAMRT